MSLKKITIVDCGMGNLFSIDRAIGYFDCQPIITSDSSKIASAERLILPGVGAFGKGMHELESRGLVDAIREFVKTERPLLGICLGMQLLMTKSYEFGLHYGINLIEGDVVRFQDPHAQGFSFKIPHVGWNKIVSPALKDNGNALGDSTWGGTILDTTPPNSYFYFVHSYVVMPFNELHILAETEYGHNRFCSVVNKDNLFGCQFHPEKSGSIGLDLLKRFCFS